jgi:predicted enzyme related to lactoylglutathione lyase
MPATAHQEDREEPHMGNPVVHFEVVGKDAQALQSFYKDAFDW